MEIGPFVVDLPIINGGSFHSYVNVYQRVIWIMPFGKQRFQWKFPEPNGGFSGKIIDVNAGGFPLQRLITRG